MSKVIYAKYNRNRRKEFQISTTIYEENGKRYAKKSPLTEEAGKHIQNMQGFYEKLQHQYTNVVLVPGKFENGEMICDFIEGKSLSDLLTTALYEMGKEEFLQYLACQLETIFSCRVPLEKYEKTKEFEYVFGDVDVNGTSMPITNVDLIFDNIVQHGNDYVCLDYEWVFDFPIPLDFVKFRSLHYFYAKNAAFLKSWLSEEELLALFAIEKDSIVPYSEMEANFQKWVFGTDNYFKNYVQHAETEVLARYDSCVGRVLQLQDEVEERNQHVQKLDTEIAGLIVDRDNLLASGEKAGQELEYKQKQVEHYIDINEQLRFVNSQLQLVIEKMQAENAQLQKEKIQLQEEKERLAESFDILQSETRDKERLVRKLEDLTTKMDTHIKGIQPGYEKWMKLTNNWMVRFPKRVARKMYHMLKKLKSAERPKKKNKIRVPHSTHPLVSIVIPVYNQFDYTYACIQSIVETVKDIPYEIIIGDDESTDRTRKIKKYISEIKVNINTSDHGFLMNCNRAAQLATGKYILFLNNDTQVREEWLSSLVELIEKDDEIGMVGSKLIYPDGKLQEAGGIIWKDGSAWNYGRNQDADLPQFNYVREVDYISGASIMIRKSLWDTIGGFDRSFVPAYCEDSDLAFQVRQQGFKVMYQPKSVVVHFEGVSNGTDLSSGMKKYQVENNRKLKEKWKNELTQQYPNAQDVFYARERNFGKKVVLFIDHYVPTFDKDAGSKTTFQYIKMFLKKGYVVKFIGDNYAQMEPYTTVLQQMGVEVLYGPWYAQHIFEWISENQQYITAVYLNRPHITEKYINWLKDNTNLKLIYYGHDLHFLRMQREAELTQNTELLEESKAWKRREFSIMRKVSMVYYPSYVEKQAIAEIDPSVPVKAITAYVYDKFLENYQYQPKTRSGILFVGGFSHGPNVDAVKWFVSEIYSIIREKSDIPFYIVGSNAPGEIKAMDGNGIHFKGFVSDEELAELYSTCKMVVVPLRYGAGVKGKVVEAIYHGAPIVTTSVGAEGIPGVENIVCIEDMPEDFAEKVLELYYNDKMLAAMGENTQKFIKDNFSMDAAWEIIKDDFQ